MKINSNAIIWTTLIFIFIYLQPSFVEALITLVSCRDLGGKRYIVANVANECYTSSYWGYSLGFVIPSIIIWVLLIPLLMLRGLRKAYIKKTLESTEIRYKYGFLYNEVNFLIIFVKKY
jgi:hypothetical protein